METEIYVVKPEDTLEKITVKFDIPLAKLLCLNDFSPLEQLVVGQAILIPHIPKTIKTLGYFQLNELTSLEQTLTEVGEFLSYGGVFQFQVTPGGAILIPQGAAVDRTVILLLAHNILPLMVITNLGPNKFDPDLARIIISDKKLQCQIFDNLLFLMDRYGFSGVNVDFENVYPEDRELFTSFIHDLKLVLETNGYVVSLTVPPKASDLPAEDPANGAYDYQALGNLADFIFIMTYDWGFMGGPPRAVAPIDEIQKVISYAVTQIPPFKILQGIPLYGYDWILPYQPGTLARVVNLVEVYQLARRYHAVINYDQEAQSPYFSYLKNGVEHIVWFEDARSITAKYQTAKSFGLGGVGYWYGKNYPYGFPQNWVIFQEMFKVIKRGKLTF